MKNIVTFFIAMMLVFGMSQCKKKTETIESVGGGKVVHITVRVGGSKHIVFPNTGAVVYGDGDVIYVGNNGHYVGSLTYSEGTFSGDITDPSTVDYLHFYFVGGLAPSAAPSAGTTTSFTVNISDQSSVLPVLSYGRSDIKYVEGTATYSCTLQNKCALVKFVPSMVTGRQIIVFGMKNVATVDFETPGIVPTGETGTINLYSYSPVSKWAILLPQAEVENPKVKIESYNSSIASVPAVTNNMYYTAGVGITMAASELPLIKADYSVSDGVTVKFSKGNLQYNKSTGYFSFMEKQYDLVERPSQNVGTDYSNQNMISLFGWGTSGCNLLGTETNYYYKPYNTDNSSGTYYGPFGLHNLTGEYINGDWGVFNNYSNQNKIEDSGNIEWHLMTKDEWLYMLNSRSTTATVNSTANARYTEATVNTDGTSVNGVILFPDEYSGGTPAGVTWGAINDTSAWETKCTIAGWRALESAGCVFLPAAGYRNGVNVQSNVGTYGNYWSSSYSNSENAYSFDFKSGYVNVLYNSKRYYGQSVRLVY